MSYDWKLRAENNSGFAVIDREQDQKNQATNEHLELIKTQDEKNTAEVNEHLLQLLQDENAEVDVKLYKDGDCRVLINGFSVEPKHFNACCRLFDKEQFTRLFSEFVLSKTRPEFLGKKVIKAGLCSLVHRDIEEI